MIWLYLSPAEHDMPERYTLMVPLECLAVMADRADMRASAGSQDAAALLLMPPEKA